MKGNMAGLAQLIGHSQPDYTRGTENIPKPRMVPLGVIFCVAWSRGLRQPLTLGPGRGSTERCGEGTADRVLWWTRTKAARMCYERNLRDRLTQQGLITAVISTLEKLRPQRQLNLWNWMSLPSQYGAETLDYSFIHVGRL